jgi:hypothetical protein
MAKKPTFQMALTEGRFVEAQYTPVIFIVDTTTHRLALHRGDVSKEWYVSDPVSGGKIVSLRGVYKGVPCSSKSLTQREAHQIAVAELEVLVSRIGGKRFNEVMSAKVLKAP